MECVTYPLVLGSLKFLNGDGLRHIIMHQTSLDVVAKCLCDDVDGGGQFLTAPLLREDEHVICRWTCIPRACRLGSTQIVAGQVLLGSIVPQPPKNGTH